MHDLLDGLLGTLTGLDPVVLLLVTGLFTAAETSMLVGMVVPGDTVMLLAGATVTSSARFAALVAVGTLGSLTGETIGYLLGHRFRDQLRNGRIGHRVGEGNWAKAEAFLNGGGGQRWPRPALLPSSMRCSRWWRAPCACPTCGS